MPRVRNTSQNNKTSDDNDENSAEKENDIEEYNENTNRRISFDQKPRNCNVIRSAFYSKYSQSPVYTVNSDDDPYCLRRVIDGKIRKFKKDSRTWLHKSSLKAKLKSGKLENATKPIQSYGEKKEDEILHLTQDMEMGLSKADDVPKCAFKEDQGQFPVNENTAGYSGSKNDRIPYMDADSDFSSLGDSDADLAYSEAPTPTGSFSYLDNWREANKTVTFQFQSQTSSEVSDIENEQMQADETCANDHADIGDQAKELEIIDESRNNCGGAPTIMDIQKKIAPAIEMESESMQESLLDFAVNLAAKRTIDVGPKYFTRLNASRTPTVSSVKHKAQTVLQTKEKKARTGRQGKQTRKNKQRVAKKKQRLLNQSSSLKEQESQDHDSAPIVSALTHHDNQIPGCSWTAELPTSGTGAPRYVPSLFVLASRRLVQNIKRNVEDRQ